MKKFSKQLSSDKVIEKAYRYERGRYVEVRS